jgi:hypothetical protein
LLPLPTSIIIIEAIMSDKPLYKLTASEVVQLTRSGKISVEE